MKKVRKKVEDMITMIQVSEVIASLEVIEVNEVNDDTCIGTKMQKPWDYDAKAKELRPNY